MHKVKFTFEWDEEKNRINIEKHQVSFYKAQEVFYDLNRIILKDIEHSNNEDRFFCFKLNDFSKKERRHEVKPVLAFAFFYFHG